MVTEKMVAKKIEQYLSGKISKRDISQWAIKTLTQKTFTTEQMLIEDALTALSLLHDENERFDTAKQDLKFFYDCLLGKKPYGVKIEFVPAS